MLVPLGEVGANFSLQLSSRTQFTKINNKKVIAENQCEKHEKSSLTTLIPEMDGLNGNIRKFHYTLMGYYWQKLQVLRFVLAFSQFGKGL